MEWNNTPRPVVAYNDITNVFCEFISVAELCRFLKLDNKQVFGVLRGKYKTTKNVKICDKEKFYSDIFNKNMKRYSTDELNSDFYVNRITNEESIKLKEKFMSLLDRKECVPIEGYPEYYIDRKGSIFRYHNGHIKWLRGTLTSNGYKRIGLIGADNKRHNEYIHKLVADNFIGIPKNKKNVFHKDGNKINNRIDNLYYDNYYTKDFENQKIENKDYKWYPIPNFPGYYICKEGHILSKRTYKENIMTGVEDSYGYKTFCMINKNNEYKIMKLHRLLAITFIDNPNNLPIVRHLDDNPHNNKLNNLAWGTLSDNQKDSIRNKTKYKPLRNKTQKTLVIFPDGHQKMYESISDIVKDLKITRNEIQHSRKGYGRYKEYKFISIDIESDFIKV